eukprot:TRINITY_DN3499_c0_g1_i4.p1 TRINITY_DN3499_c0_g1~~TRINITY_DN3499_c0_g1_i4.p1  ORF type:complete len:207 (-),score=49.43 TRINITY_DN3499_c0_g1_i4:504-1124(-)
MVEAAAAAALREYEVLKVVGRGTFSVVLKARHRTRGTLHAVKAVNKSCVNNKQLGLECEILQSLHHPNIVQLQEVVKSADQVYMVMEYAAGGELYNRILKKERYTEEDAKVLIRNILSAVNYMHQNNITHRDLKPENLLLRSKENDTDVLVADLGFARILSKDSVAKTLCGSPHYVAPEVLLADGSRLLSPWGVAMARLWTSGLSA